MIAALLIRMPTLRPESRIRSANPWTLLEVAEVELADLHAVDPGQRLLGDVGPAGGDDDLRPGAGERADGLERRCRSNRR